MTNPDTQRPDNNHGECACAACDPPDSERNPETEHAEIPGWTEEPF